MNKKIFIKLLRILLAVFGLTTVFLSGSLHENTHFERIAEYSSKVVKTNTIDKKYFAISFDAPDKSGDYYSSELANLFDVFRSNIVTYASGMNVHKEKSIRILDYSDNNLSMFFVGAVGSMAIKDINGDTIGWRHGTYNIDTMFADPEYNHTEYDRKGAPIIYLSQTQADKILESRGIAREGELYSEDQYKTLIQTEINLCIENDNNCIYYIWNIFYNRGFYCEGLTNILGDYVLTSYKQPSNHNLRAIHKSLYYFNEYSYYNQYLMRYLNTRFSENNIFPSVVKYNLLGDVDCEYLISFFHNESISAKQWAFVLLIVFSISILLTSVFLLFREKKDNIAFMILTIITLFFPYFVFKAIFFVSGDIIFFSQPSSKLYALFVIIYIFIYIYKSSIQKKTCRDLKRYEIGI